MIQRLASVVSVVLLLLATMPVRAGGPSSSVRLEPEKVEIGIFYSGQSIQVKATAPASEDVVMRLTGPKEPLVLKKKGKKYGILWMNVGEVHYEAVPTLYLLRSSRKLDEIATAATLHKLKLGFDALRDQIPADSKDGARELFGELVKLKQRDHLFSSEAAGIELHSGESGRQEAIGEFTLPPKAPVGDYTVEVFGFRKDAGFSVGTATVHLQRAPAVSSITSLATNHGLLYGCLAVAVAVLAGLFTGLIFGK